MPNIPPLDGRNLHPWAPGNADGPLSSAQIGHAPVSTQSNASEPGWSHAPVLGSIELGKYSTFRHSTLSVNMRRKPLSMQIGWRHSAAAKIVSVDQKETVAMVNTIRCI